jgi:thymidylate kinase
MLITFSGLDGAGKSTLIEWLKTALRERGREVTVFHLNDHIGLYAYARFLRDRVRGVQQSPVASRPSPGTAKSRSGSPFQPVPGGWRLAAGIGRAEQPLKGSRDPHCLRERFLRVRYRILWNKAARRWIYLLDLGIFLGYRFYIEVLRKQILVMDRYFYDTLVDLSDGRSPRFSQFLARLTPIPTVPIFVDVTPEHAFARKGEYSVEHLARRRVTYRRIFDGLPCPVVLENEELNTAQRVLARVVTERMVAP